MIERLKLEQTVEYFTNRKNYSRTIIFRIDTMACYFEALR